jgi:hypothetical protein
VAPLRVQQSCSDICSTLVNQATVFTKEVLGRIKWSEQCLMLGMFSLLLLKVIDKELHRQLEAVKSSLIALSLKSNLLKRHKEVVDMFQNSLVIASKHN